MKKKVLCAVSIICVILGIILFFCFFSIKIEKRSKSDKETTYMKIPNSYYGALQNSIDDLLRDTETKEFFAADKNSYKSFCDILQDLRSNLEKNNDPYMVLDKYMYKILDLISSTNFNKGKIGDLINHTAKFLKKILQNHESDLKIIIDLIIEILDENKFYPKNYEENMQENLNE